MFKKSKIKITVLLYVLIFVCLYSYAQDKTRYLKGFCQVFKTKYYRGNYALDMKYSFAVCDVKGLVWDEILNTQTSFTPKKGAGADAGSTKKNLRYDFNLVIIEQDDDKGIFVFDIMIRYKGKFYQAKIKKLIPFDGKKTEIFSFNMNDYVKDPKLLKELDEYYIKRKKNPWKSSNSVNFEEYKKKLISESLTGKIKNPPKEVVRKARRAPQFKKDSLDKYWNDEKKGLNIKDSTNVERIKRGMQPILFLLRKPITWEVNPKRKPKQSQ